MENQQNSDKQNELFLTFLQEEIKLLKEKLEQHEKTHENFRTSFRNLEGLITNLRDRNHLR